MSDNAEIDEAIDAIFNHYDTDKNGTLDKEEAKVFFDELFNSMGDTIPPESHVVIINSIDENGDGEISREELKEIMTESLFKNM